MFSTTPQMKRKQSNATFVYEPAPPQKPSNHRKRLTIALGALAILATGFASGMWTSTIYDGGARRGSQEVSQVEISAGFGDLMQYEHPRDLRKASVKVAHASNALKPAKLFGPNLTPEAMAIRKRRNSLASSQERDIDEIPDNIETRDLEKRGVWQPSPGLNWTYQLSVSPTAAQLRKPAQYQVWDIDLFDTPVGTIRKIHAAGSKVICYFSAGTVEEWRTDASKFLTTDDGNPMGDWPGETWLNTNSANVRAVMAARLDLAKAKGCDGIDPDNIDAYNHDTGFGLVQADAISYITYLSQQASTRGLAMGLKNSGEIIPSVINSIQYIVEEACSAYNECDIYKPVTDAGKPVFHVEYPKGYGVVNTQKVGTSPMKTICGCVSKWNYSPIVKNNNLDSWQQGC